MKKDVLLMGGAADMLRHYIQKNGLNAAHVLETLAPFTSSQRMPILLFFQQLEAVHALHPVAALGLRIGRCAKPEHFGIVGYLAASCNSLGQALMRYRRFQTLLVSNLHVRVSQQGDVLRFTWRKGSPLANEVAVASFVKLMQALIGHDIAPLAVEFPHASPPDPAIYEVLMGCPVRFGAPAIGLEIPAGLLAMRIVSSDPYMRALFEQQASAMLVQPPQPDQYLASLKKYIAGALQDGEPSASALAQQMHCSLRTFYRELASHGLRYRTVLADTRFQMARLYLADARLSLVEIALLLGYSEQSAFTRAFRGWTSSTPLEYRRQVLKVPFTPAAP